MAVIRSLKLFADRNAVNHPATVAIVDVAADDEEDLPLPSDLKTVFLGGIFALSVLAGCYVAAEIVLPIVLAFVLGLVLQPAMRQLERVHLPRTLSALLMIAVLFGALTGLAAALTGPAVSWAQKLPAGIPSCSNA